MSVTIKKIIILSAISLVGFLFANKHITHAFNDSYTDFFDQVSSFINTNNKNDFNQGLIISNDVTNISNTGNNSANTTNDGISSTQIKIKTEINGQTVTDINQISTSTGKATITSNQTISTEKNQTQSKIIINSNTSAQPKIVAQKITPPEIVPPKKADNTNKSKISTQKTIQRASIASTGESLNLKLESQQVIQPTSQTKPAEKSNPFISFWHKAWNFFIDIFTLI